MSRWKPCKRKGFIKKLRTIGFQGPFSGAKHQFMINNNHRLAIPSNTEYSIPQLKYMLKEVARIIGRNLSANEWETL
ncbi:MAG: hypothetical protein J7K04_08375 [Spirochaetales bacterium]|nr:hypothetical protein [Spirochaetales bacterium]